MKHLHENKIEVGIVSI